LFEVDEAATRIREEVDEEANIIIGATFDEKLEGVVRVSVVATGIDNLDSATQPAESLLTELAGRLRNDNRRTASQIERRAAPPPLANPQLRPSQPAPQGLDPHGRSPAVRSSVEERVLDMPAFLSRRAV
jgi:cell division protein FtsZ